MQTPQTVVESLKRRQYAPVYFFQGDEPYYIDWLVSYIEDNVLDSVERSLNQMVVYGKSQSLQEVIAQARCLPMMGERQVLIVKEAQDMVELQREPGQALLIKYLEQPNPATLLVFAYKDKEIDRRKKFYKFLETHAVLVTSKKLYDNQVPDWILSYAQQHRYTITPKAASMLYALVGNDLNKLVNEFDKIFANMPPGSHIDDVTIETYVGMSKEFNAFELQRALADKDVYQAQLIVCHFDRNPRRNPIIPTLALLFSFFSRLLLVHQSKDRTKDHLSKLLQVNPYFVGMYLTAARKYSPTQVIANIHWLHQADLKAKGVESSALREGEILKELVCKLMNSESVV